MIAPSTAGANTKWFDEFFAECLLLNCRIDYLNTHRYAGTVDEKMAKLKAYSERYGNKKIWLTEFAVSKEGNEDEIVKHVEELLPRLERADFIEKYAWWYTRYYEDHDHSGYFWLDSYNSLLQEDGPFLTKVGEAYNKPWHLI